MTCTFAGLSLLVHLVLVLVHFRGAGLGCRGGGARPEQGGKVEAGHAGCGSISDSLCSERGGQGAADAGSGCGRKGAGQGGLGKRPERERPVRMKAKRALFLGVSAWARRRGARVWSRIFAVL